jgi:hypothetical protein
MTKFTVLYGIGIVNTTIKIQLFHNKLRKREIKSYLNLFLIQMQRKWNNKSNNRLKFGSLNGMCYKRSELKDKLVNRICYFFLRKLCL